MRILLTGTTGMLGSKILEKVNYDFIKPTRKDCDLSKPYEVESFLKKLPSIDGIWHIAAYTDVEGAEEKKEYAFLVNWISTKILTDFSIKKNIRILYISTDYVFDGYKREPYSEWDTPNPLNIYGKSKLFGEREVLRNRDSLIIRTSWLFGEKGENFITKIINGAKKKRELKVVIDQCGSPTYTEDLTEGIVRLWTSEETGVFHFSNKGEVTRFELAKEVIDLLNLDVHIIPSTSEELNLKAKRPSYSVLSTFLFENKTNMKIRTYREALQDYLKGIF
ncbi:MAG: dTDP-4-dehydrorhamnose reductase [Candidatus Hydrothermales bacterium]